MDVFVQLRRLGGRPLHDIGNTNTDIVGWITTQGAREETIYCPISIATYKGGALKEVSSAQKKYWFVHTSWINQRISCEGQLDQLLKDLLVYKGP